jgi:hypothetical protein
MRGTASWTLIAILFLSLIAAPAVTGAASNLNPHDNIPSNIIRPAVQGETTLWVNHSAVDLNGSTAFNTGGGPAQVSPTQPLVLSTSTGSITVDDPTKFQGNLVMNGNNVVNVPEVTSDDLTITADSGSVALTASDEVRFVQGGTGEFLVDNGYASFDAGTGFDAFTSTVNINDYTVPVGDAIPPFVDSDIVSAYQDLGYNNLNDPTNDSVTHRVRITNGSNAIINDYYEPDDQELGIYAPPTGASQVISHQVTLDDGNSILIPDSFEEDTTIPDDQSLTISSSPKATSDDYAVSVAIDTPSGTDTATFTDRHTLYSAGPGLSMSGTTLSIAASSCSTDYALSWTGTGFTCVELKEYSAGEGVGLSGTTFSSGGGAGISAGASGHSLAINQVCDPGELVSGITSTGVNCKDMNP